jgi:hypothetical protein
MARWPLVTFRWIRLEASRARWRIHALEIAARPHVKPSMRAAHLSAQGV